MNNTLQLEINNFQSIEHGVLGFEPGITAITGSNASGKTASFRALRALILNQIGSKHYIKHGSSEARVHLTYNDMDIAWSRSNKEVNYFYEGNEFLKAGKVNSFDITDNKIPFVLDEKGRLINMHTEWDVLFPFDKSETELFKLFEDIFNVSDSAKIIAAIKNDEDCCNKDINALTNNKISNDTKIKAIDDFLTACSYDVLANYKSKFENILNEQHRVSNDMAAVSSNWPYINIELPAKKEFSTELFSEIVKLQGDIQIVKHNDNMANYNIPKAKDFDVTIFNELKSLCKDVEDIALTSLNMQKEYKENQTLIQEKELYEQKLKEYKTCPLCGK
jgi:DNA repair ATPase RecN